MNYRVWKNLGNRSILITGATDGIGKAIALELSKRKKNIIILGRNSEKLEDVKSEIIKNGSNCVSFLCDLSKEQDFDFLKPEEQTPKDLLNIGMLINNAGVSSEHPKYLIEDNRIDDIIKVNMLNLVKLTQKILQNMKNGYVINIGSMLADTTSPLLSTYSASKSFLKSFSLSLNIEEANRITSSKKKINNHVELINTGLVCSKMSKVRKDNLFTPTSQNFAKSILETIGSLKENFPYLPHLFLYVLLSLIPKFIKGNGLYKINGITRNVALKKSKKN